MWRKSAGTTSEREWDWGDREMIEHAVEPPGTIQWLIRHAVPGGYISWWLFKLHGENSLSTFYKHYAYADSGCCYQGSDVQRLQRKDQRRPPQRLRPRKRIKPIRAYMPDRIVTVNGYCHGRDGRLEAANVAAEAKVEATLQHLVCKPHPAARPTR
ncbi:hypothetical protein B0H19DRAFT_1065501 [Mycena capillaripes]|nr:hypothetical protein B0H19DRAFT_1065501 [Mycena capillaripes]